MIWHGYKGLLLCLFLGKVVGHLWMSSDTVDEGLQRWHLVQKFKSTAHFQQPRRLEYGKVCQRDAVTRHEALTAIIALQNLLDVGQTRRNDLLQGLGFQFFLLGLVTQEDVSGDWFASFLESGVNDVNLGPFDVRASEQTKLKGRNNNSTDWMPKNMKGKNNQTLNGIRPAGR